MITPSYRNFVEYRARANPCVSRLSNYLQHECVGESKVTYLDYTNQSLEPRRIDVPEDEISQLLNMSPSVSTRFVFVENISPGLMILLGEKLDIDPLFFTDYIHAAFANLEKTSPPPSLATLPSSIATRDHIHLHCQKVIALEGTDDELKKAPYDLKTRSNVPRHVRRLVTLPGRRLALAQTCCSFIIKSIGDMNICLFLMDPAATSVVHHLYSDQLKAGHLHDEVLLDLQRWKRRSRSSHRKLNILRDVISSHILPSDDATVWNGALNDINYLRDQLHDYSQSLEQMVMVATSLVQLLDSRRSILEAINTKRLTFLALVFVPLAWVSSLFSMSDSYSPGHNLFWVYFATALPVLAVVLLLSALPHGKVAIAAESYKARVRNRGMRVLGEPV
ncbi:hypothetical protein FOXG_15377 [Fusarium oxysporum f. sp. lycopersici 4287]|uniref:Magnesium transport protein CorA n=1 Tax=Fusarium oxysporum f. sp. lycopersici (strain 4287 / CBS 123668 / FGSC 9935 / NRRL 34936) TaxID=426428 RepID=A0A0J9W2J0_FUSO4|nr:hypothetical protein FOXG_15377 [Fusarium oxysporum f. sp. lycopersici 4287]KNB17289.1 hypothetical protein FOXG_15377 [Fusarium oxysporum f. sp. lycopersici 4287]